MPISLVKTPLRLDAGSVLTIRTRRPSSASETASAAAVVVLPTPPLPVNRMSRVSQPPGLASEP